MKKLLILSLLLSLATFSAPLSIGSGSNTQVGSGTYTDILVDGHDNTVTNGGTNMYIFGGENQANNINRLILGGTKNMAINLLDTSILG